MNGGKQFATQEDAEAVWGYHLNKDRDDFEDGLYPIEGGEWDEAVSVAISSIFEDFVFAFRGKAESEGDGLLITRCLGVDSIEDFIAALEESETLPGYEGLGIYWSWDRDKADCHWGKGSNKIYVHAKVSLDDIDYRQTAFVNLDYASEFSEAEITLKPGSEVEAAIIYIPK